jgi:hypothetical protein
MPEAPLVLVAILYWFALAAWFGAALLAAAALPAIERATRAVAGEGFLEGELAAGRVSVALLAMLWQIELACVVVLLVAQAAEWVAVLTGRTDALLPAVRTALLVAAGIAAATTGRVLRPRLARQLDEVAEDAADDDEESAAAAAYDRTRRDVANALTADVLLLAGVVLFAALGIASTTARVFDFGG